jgi:hypothetical protein
MAWRLASLGMGIRGLASLGMGSALGLWLWLRTRLSLLVDRVGLAPMRVGLIARDLSVAESGGHASIFARSASEISKLAVTF